MKLCALVLALVPLAASAQQQEIQRMLIERDRQSAEFSRPELRDLHQRQDRSALGPRPDERGAQARERDAELLRTAPRPLPHPDAGPLPLPGGPQHGVDPIPVQGGGN
jgi:hypothetical protein